MCPFCRLHYSAFCLLASLRLQQPHYSNSSFTSRSWGFFLIITLLLLFLSSFGSYLIKKNKPRPRSWFIESSRLKRISVDPIPSCLLPKSHQAVTSKSGVIKCLPRGGPQLKPRSAQIKDQNCWHLLEPYLMPRLPPTSPFRLFAHSFFPYLLALSLPSVALIS